MVYFLSYHDISVKIVLAGGNTEPMLKLNSFVHHLASPKCISKFLHQNEKKTACFLLSLLVSIPQLGGQLSD